MTVSSITQSQVNNPDVQSANSDWNIPAALKAVNDLSEKEHYELHKEPITAIRDSFSPNANPDTKLKAAEYLKAYTGPKNNEDYAGSHEFRLDEALGSQNLGDLVKAFTGGSDRREIGRNGEGIPVVTVYNGRGDVRRYEWANGERISPEELAKLGPVSSVRDISAERAAAYKAKGLSATAIQTAMANDWSNVLKKSSVAASTADSLIDAGSQIKELAGRLVPYSVNPETRAFLARVNTLTNDRNQQRSLAKDTVNKIATGQVESKEANNTLSKIQGINGPLVFTKNQGILNSKGEKASNEEINDVVNKLAEQNSTTDKITSNAQNLMNEAQLLASQKKIENIDDITRLIGLKRQAAELSNKLKEVGGIPGAVTAPNVDHNVTDSFSLAYTNGEYTEAEGKLAKAYAEHVRKALATLGNRAPDIGSVEAEFATGTMARGLRANRTLNIERFLKEHASELENLNKQQIPKEIVNQVNGTPVAPPPDISAKVPTSKPETKSETKETTKETNQEKLIRLFGSPNKRQ